MLLFELKNQLFQKIEKKCKMLKNFERKIIMNQSDLIKLKYAIVDNSSNFFNIYVFKDTTVYELLKIISDEQRREYTILLFEQSEMSPDDLIFDFYDVDPNHIFIAANESNFPTTEFYFNLMSANEIKAKLPKAKADSIKEFTFFFTGSDKYMLYYFHSN